MTPRQISIGCAMAVALALHGAARADMPGCDLLGGGDSFGPKGACCDAHDKCYADNGCTEASWNGSEGPVCSQCNANVQNCFLSSSNPGPSICTLIPGHGINNTICQDPAWNCGWYCWSGMVQPPPVCQPNCPSACGQGDGCGGTCPLFVNGWTCDACFGCRACGDCTCGGTCHAPFTCDPNTDICSCTSSCTAPLCGQTDSCGRQCPNTDDTCGGQGGYTNACGRYCPEICSWYDCFGICNGPYRLDACGVCGGDGSSCACHWYDCFGICNGPYWWDQCGVCGGDGSSCACYWYDCFGICNGPYQYDWCGVCGGDGTSCLP